MTLLATPRRFDEISPLIDAEMLAMLVADECVFSADDAAELMARLGEPWTKAKPCKRVVLGVTGAIGAAQVVPLMAYLHRNFAERLDVVLTAAACKLVPPDVFRYFGVEAWTDTFAPRGEVNVPHMFLAAADLVIIAPTSVNTIHKLATGACSDLLSLLVVATRAPVVLAPSMNMTMWENPAVAQNIETLRARGFYIVEPTIGVRVSLKKEPSWDFGPANLEPQTWASLLASVVAPAASG